ncbi:hypothetical protein, partial [Lelliottia amnigena]
PAENALFHADSNNITHLPEEILERIINKLDVFAKMKLSESGNHILERITRKALISDKAKYIRLDNFLSLSKVANDSNKEKITLLSGAWHARSYNKIPDDIYALKFNHLHRARADIKEGFFSQPFNLYTFDYLTGVNNYGRPLSHQWLPTRLFNLGEINYQDLTIGT